MALETGTYISDLNSSNPTATDVKSEGDDHLRLIKSTVKATFPNVSGAVTATHTELNLLDGATVSTSQINQLNGQGCLISEGYATGGGTPDAITADFTPNVSLTDGLTVLVKSAGPITVTNPTFAPDGLTAKTIYNAKGSALAIGDITSTDQSLLLQYDLTLDGWILLNSASQAHRGALVNNSGLSQTITSSAVPAITFNTEAYDTDAIHDTVTNSDRLTVPAGVTKIKLSLQVCWEANATGYRRALVYKNGSNAHFDGRPEVISTSVGSGLTEIQQAQSPVINVVANDYFDLRVNHNVGADLDVFTDQNRTWFAMEIIQ
jgi:hypothetical protein